MNYAKLLSDFNNMFLDKNNVEKEKVFLDFLQSYELQRSFNIDQKSAFLNSIKTPTRALNSNQLLQKEAQNKALKIEKKKKRSKKYMVLTRYQSEIFAMKSQGLSYEKIAKSLIVKHSIPKNLQPSRQNIYNFYKDNFHA